MKLIVAAVVALTLAGCAQQDRSASLTPEQRAIAIGALMNHWQYPAAYQQPFYPMQPIPSPHYCYGCRY